MLLPVYLGLLDHSEDSLAKSFRQVADGHGDEPDVFHLCHTLAEHCEDHRQALAPALRRYGEQPDDEPERLHAEALPAARTGPLGLLRDLQDLYLLASLVDITWTVVKQAAMGVRDSELVGIVEESENDTKRQLSWLSTRMKQAAPQALIVAERESAGTGEGRFGRLGAAVYAGVLCLLVLALTGVVGLLTHLPWLFPSLGPTVMLFFEAPEQPSSRPLNTLVGHGVGTLVGVGCLAAFGLFGQPPATVAKLTPAYLFSGALSVALTTVGWC